MESSARQPKLLDRVRQAVRVRHDSRRTEDAYVRWIKTYPVVRARTPERLPVVLSRSEVASLFGQLSGPLRLIVTPLYGAGLRLDECLELRVKDLDFERDRITVRQGKGRKDRVTMLPASAKEPLRTDWDASCFRTRSSGSLRVRRRTGGGNLCFRRGACAAIRDLGSRHGITCTNRSCRRQSRGRRVQRV